MLLSNNTFFPFFLSIYKMHFCAIRFEKTYNFNKNNTTHITQKTLDKTINDFTS